MNGDGAGVFVLDSLSAQPIINGDFDSGRIADSVRRRDCAVRENQLVAGQGGLVM